MHRPKKTTSIMSRIIRFLTWNLGGALLPLIISFAIRKISEIAAPPGVYAPELLFFAIMVSATTLGDIADEVKLTGNGAVFQTLRGILILGTIFSAALFGVYQYDQIAGPGNAQFRANITTYALVIAASFFLTSLLSEILLARVQGGIQ